MPPLMSDPPTVRDSLRRLARDIDSVMSELDALRQRATSLAWLLEAPDLPLESIAAEVAIAYGTETKIRQIVILRKLVSDSGRLLALVDAKALMDEAWRSSNHRRSLSTSL
jgi:hypothetical protein